MTRILVLSILAMCCTMATAQTDRQHIRDGNRLYRQQKFDKAEVEYRKAVEKNKENPQAYYNLGCALMQQQKDSLAVTNLETAGKLETSKIRKAKVYHNIGVICQSHQLFSEAIEAYKESLRNNPTDDETRYNLALCQKQLKNQKNDKNQKNNNDNKDKDKKNNEKNNQDKQKQNDKNKDNKQQQKQQDDQMSKENAEQLLQAALQEEKNTQQKMKKQQAMPQKRRLQKNW
jgi:hypothetical protein